MGQVTPFLMDQLGHVTLFLNLMDQLGQVTLFLIDLLGQVTPFLTCSGLHYVDAMVCFIINLLHLGFAIYRQTKSK